VKQRQPPVADRRLLLRLLLMSLWVIVPGAASPAEKTPDPALWGLCLRLRLLLLFLQQLLLLLRSFWWRLPGCCCCCCCLADRPCCCTSRTSCI
jgi:hypothetical protein